MSMTRRSVIAPAVAVLVSVFAGGDGRELAIQHIGGDRLIVIAHRRAFEPPRARYKAVLAHQAGDALAADGFACLD